MCRGRSDRARRISFQDRPSETPTAREGGAESVTADAGLAIRCAPGETGSVDFARAMEPGMRSSRSPHNVQRRVAAWAGVVWQDLQPERGGESGVSKTRNIVLGKVLV